MASIYYCGTPPAGSWWVQLYHPRDGKPIRESLETTDQARAKLLCRRIELEAELARPEYTFLGVPSALMERLGRAPQNPPSFSGSPLALSPSNHAISPDQSSAQLTPPAESPRPTAPSPATEKLGGPTIEQALAGIDSPLVLKFLTGLDIARKSKRHYRELLHNFFEVMIANGPPDKSSSAKSDVSPAFIF